MATIAAVDHTTTPAVAVPKEVTTSGRNKRRSGCA